MEKDKPRAKEGQGSKSSTEDVLGTQVGQSNVDPKWEKRYRGLADLRESILNRRRDLLSQAAEEVTPAQRNQADVGTDHYDRDWALSMASSEQELLYEIDEALNRIRNGTHGICEATGKPIDPERLRAIPWTRFSAEVEKQVEAEGQTSRARLSPVEEVPKVGTETSVEEE
jgi:RNA polymerase-binding transcription factor DksA